MMFWVLRKKREWMSNKEISIVQNKKEGIEEA
jgi:hypothetical protein